YNTLPTSSSAVPDVVVGQADFTSGASGTEQNALNFPRYAMSDGTRLYIADSGNNRILVYNRIPTQNGVFADVVLGHTEFDDKSEGIASNRMALPTALAISPTGGLLVADVNNRRVLEFRPGLPLVKLDGVVNAASFSGNGLRRPVITNFSVLDGGNIPAGTY